MLAIIWPTLALVALIFCVWAALFLARELHLRRTPPPPRTLEDADAAARYFGPVDAPARNLANLFEMPVLYLALVPLLIVAHRADGWQMALAWAFVTLRAAYSVVQIAHGPSQARFLVYLASCVVLAAMWIGFGLDLATMR